MIHASISAAAHSNNVLRAGGVDSRRADFLRSLAPLGYEAAMQALSVSPLPEPPVVADEAPSVHDTATTTLNSIVDSGHDNDGLCYLENAIKVRLVLEDHLAALQADSEANADEIERVTRLIGVLSYADKIVNGGSGRNADAQAAFPDASLNVALADAKAMYRIMGTISVTGQPTPMRAGGVGGALAAMGGGEMIYQDEMLAGGLRPGAPLQMWWGGEYQLRGQSDVTEMSGKDVYQNFTRGRMASGQMVGGHSVTFVRYDEGDPTTIWYLQQWDNTLASQQLGTDDYTYFVGANLSTTGDAELTAEYLLRDTEFVCDYGKDLLVARAATHGLDAGAMSDRLLAGIAASTHADAATLQQAADRLGRQTTFGHDLVRLVGIWQQATGLSCTGDFDDDASVALTGQDLANATSIQAR